MAWSFKKYVGALNHIVDFPIKHVKKEDAIEIDEKGKESVKEYFISDTEDGKIKYIEIEIDKIKEDIDLINVKLQLILIRDLRIIRNWIIFFAVITIVSILIIGGYYIYLMSLAQNVYGKF